LTFPLARFIFRVVFPVSSKPKTSGLSNIPVPAEPQSVVVISEPMPRVEAKTKPGKATRSTTTHYSLNRWLAFDKVSAIPFQRLRSRSIDNSHLGLARLQPLHPRPAHRLRDSDTKPPIFYLPSHRIANGGWRNCPMYADARRRMGCPLCN
jgi:hypothetical protein